MVARHIPGYRYCGPGTEDFSVDPINGLDAACRRHDLAYAASRSRVNRAKADMNLYLSARSLRAQHPFASRLVMAAMLTAPGVWYNG